MEVEIRRLRPGEERAFIRSVRVPFLDPASGEEADEKRFESGIRATETERSWVAVDGGRFVGNCGFHSLDVTVPAAPGQPCPVLPMGGITRVGVHPTHRRRGLLRRMMAEMLADGRRRGEALAGLHASEAGIYGRFGFGLATEAAHFAIDSREAAMLRSPPRLDIALVEKDEALKILPELFDRQRRARAGEPSRNQLKWQSYLDDPPAQRGGGNAIFVAVCDEGYVAYRAKEDPGDIHRGEIIVEELRGITPDVEAALWQFVFEIDLIDQVTARQRPVDEPLRWRLRDPRQLRLTDMEDRLYLRVLDVPGAFAARGYCEEGQVVLDVAPAEVPDDGDPVPGRWVIEAGPDGSACRRGGSGDEPGLRLDVTALGSLYMGGFRASSLAAAGRIEELKPGSLRAADRLFTTWPAPLTKTGF